MKYADHRLPSLSTLLFVTDFSEASDQAFQWAVPEALKHHWKISVLFAYRLQPSGRQGEGVNTKKDLDREAKVNFERKLEETLRSQKIPYEFHAEVGFIRDRINEHARRSNIALLVMSRQLSKMESCAELLEEIKIPTVIIPSTKK